MGDYVLIQTSGEKPVAMIWRHQTEKSALDTALKVSRELNAEFVIAKVIGEVTRSTQWKPRIADSAGADGK